MRGDIVGMGVVKEVTWGVVSGVDRDEEEGDIGEVGGGGELLELG